MNIKPDKWDVKVGYSNGWEETIQIEAQDRTAVRDKLKVRTNIIRIYSITKAKQHEDTK